MNNKNLVITLAAILAIASVSVSAIQRRSVKMCRNDNNDLVPCSSIERPIMGNYETTDTDDDIMTTQTDTSKAFGEYYTPSETWKE